MKTLEEQQILCFVLAYTIVLIIAVIYIIFILIKKI